VAGDPRRGRACNVAALIIKLHHVIADILGALQLNELVFDHERDPSRDRLVPLIGEPERLTEIDLLRRSLTPDPG